MNSQLGRAFIVVACVCLVTGLSAGTAAQGLSDMRGTVVDTSGGALPGVSIVLTNQASGTFREVTSNVDGSWYVPGLTPGTYQVAAEIAAMKVALQNAGLCGGDIGYINASRHLHAA